MKTNGITSPATWSGSLVEIDRLTKDCQSVGAKVHALKGVAA